MINHDTIYVRKNGVAKLFFLLKKFNHTVDNKRLPDFVDSTGGQFLTLLSEIEHSEFTFQERLKEISEKPWKNFRSMQLKKSKSNKIVK